MHRSPSHLPPDGRARLAGTLHGCLADGLALHGPLRVAPWNRRGSPFAPLQLLFQTVAVSLAAHHDTFAGPPLMLGAKACDGRQGARSLPLRDQLLQSAHPMEPGQLVAERSDQCLAGLHKLYGAADRHGDTLPVHRLSRPITGSNQRAWLLRASREG